MLHILAQKIRINHELIGFSKAAQRFAYLLNTVVWFAPWLSFTPSWKIFLYKKAVSEAVVKLILFLHFQERHSLCTLSTHFITLHQEEETSSADNLMPPRAQLLFSLVCSIFPHIFFFSLPHFSKISLFFFPCLLPQASLKQTHDCKIIQTWWGWCT